MAIRVKMANGKTKSFQKSAFSSRQGAKKGSKADAFGLMKVNALGAYRAVSLHEAAKVAGSEFVVVEPRVQIDPARRRAISDAVAAVVEERREKERADLG